jgi:hypothetical protein
MRKVWKDAIGDRESNVIERKTDAGHDASPTPFPSVLAVLGSR